VIYVCMDFYRYFEKSRNLTIRSLQKFLKQFLRIFNSICPSWSGYYGGASAYSNIPAIEAHLFLSANADDVAQTLNAGCAAAIILMPYGITNQETS